MIELPEEPERIPGKVIGWTIAGTVVAVVASVVIVGGFLGFDYDGGGRGNDVEIRLRPPASTFEGMVGSTPLEMQRRVQAYALDSWQWADAAHTRVRVPVDVAIDRYLHRSAK